MDAFQLEPAIRRREECTFCYAFLSQFWMIFDRLVVTDMLAAVLNICAQKELEGSDGSAAASVAPVDRDVAERRKVIKNKTLAVGRMAHFFSLLWCVLCVPLVQWANPLTLLVLLSV